MNKNKLAAALIAVVAAGTAPGASAGLFRCGNVFQDRPCESGVQQEILKPGRSGASTGGAPTAATKASPYAGVCGRMGEHAQRMVWQREGGATIERQMADLPRGADRQELQLVLESVYAKRGSATEIRGQVEAECVQRKQDSAAAAEALRDLQQRANQPGGVAAPPPSATPVTAREQPPPATQPAAKGAQPSGLCASWREQRTAIEARLRSGGSAQTMEMYQRQRRDVEKQMSEGNCG
jgi:hypothetical protein